MMTNEKSTTMTAETTNTTKEEIKMTENMVYETILAILSGEEVTEETKEAVRVYVEEKILKRKEELEKRTKERKEEEAEIEGEMKAHEWVGEDNAVTVKEMREAGIEYSSAKLAAILKRLRENGVAGNTMIKRTNYYYLIAE